jgi:hypothetical protein
MHALLYVCLPRSQARSSLQTRKKVCAYLTEEGFDTERRFSGHCDWFQVGGRWSGQLTLLRLQYQQPKRSEKLWDRLLAAPSDEEDKEAVRLFREAFLGVRVKLPLRRSSIGDYGEPDDAQIMDEPLFEQLKMGFSEEVTHADEPAQVIFTTDCYVLEPDGDFPWPKNGTEGAKFWVVVIDYHF